MAAASERKILLIDDSEISLHFAEQLLRKNGYEVRATTSLQELDDELGVWRPDVILTDVQMPGMSGVELCTWLKNRYDTAHVPVFLFSGLSSAELEELARECGADGFLSKVNGLDKLIEELELLCQAALW